MAEYGKAAGCNPAHGGSNPPGASKRWYTESAQQNKTMRCGVTETWRPHKPYATGSNPVTATRKGTSMKMDGSRILLFVSAACFLIAALTAAFGIDLGPALAWVFGGFSAWALSGAV